jgi:hypothetical protein
MGRVIVQNEPSSAIERLLDSIKRSGLDRLEAILACTFTFDGSYFGQILDALAASESQGLDRLRSIPVDVVCDRRHYRGHPADYNVHCWAGENLFHPKLVVLLFTDRIAWVEGSLNLTRAGYSNNRELVTYHEDVRRKLSQGTRKLVQQLAIQGVDAAQRIHAAANGPLKTEVSNRSFTSLDAPILERFLNRTQRAESVYIVSPFLDQREQAGVALDSSILKTLAKRYPKAQFRVFLPEIARVNGERALQGSKGLFISAFGPKATKERLGICGVPSDERRLHAKLLVMRHGKSGARASVLTGSPNLTENALSRAGSKANVELARALNIRWKDVQKILRPLGSRFKPLSQCKFEPMQATVVPGWPVLKSATYHPLQGELELEWRRPGDLSLTQLYYAGASLAAPAHGPIRGFGIRNGELRIETVSRENPNRRSWFPIVIPFGEQLALTGLPEEGIPSPEWWLSQLGGLPAKSIPGAERQSAGGKNDPSPPTGFSLGQKVRDLAERMHYVENLFVNSDALKPYEINAHLDLLEKIFELHDPGGVNDVGEKLWRLWVRLEVAGIITSAASRVRRRRDRARKLASELRRQLLTSKVPADLRLQWRALAGATA